MKCFRWGLLFVLAALASSVLVGPCHGQLFRRGRQYGGCNGGAAPVSYGYSYGNGYSYGGGYSQPAVRFEYRTPRRRIDVQVGGYARPSYYDGPRVYESRSYGNGYSYGDGYSQPAYFAPPRVYESRSYGNGYSYGDGYSYGNGYGGQVQTFAPAPQPFYCPTCR